MRNISTFPKRTNRPDVEVTEVGQVGERQRLYQLQPIALQVNGVEFEEAVEGLRVNPKVSEWAPFVHFSVSFHFHKKKWRTTYLIKRFLLRTMAWMNGVR